MKATTAIPNAARGEVLLTVGGQPHVLKFNLRVLYAWTMLTGNAPSDFAHELDRNYLEALSGLVACSVRVCVPGQEKFTQEQAIDLIQELSLEQAEELAHGVITACTPDPLMAALRKQVAAKAATMKAQPQSGADTSASA